MVALRPVPLPLSACPPWATQASLKGRYFVKRAGKRLRLVGAGVAGRKGGDPWVALRPVPHGRRKRPHSTAPFSRPYERLPAMGDASVPTPLRPSPAPTTVTICPIKTASGWYASA